MVGYSHALVGCSLTAAKAWSSMIGRVLPTHPANPGKPGNVESHFPLMDKA